jgi:hypothetical protein
VSRKKPRHARFETHPPATPSHTVVCVCVCVYGGGGRVTQFMEALRPLQRRNFWSLRVSWKKTFSLSSEEWAYYKSSTIPGFVHRSGAKCLGVGGGENCGEF